MSNEVERITVAQKGACLDAVEGVEEEADGREGEEEGLKGS